MNFGEVLTRAWNIIWKNKILLLFGFFASLGAGGNSGSSSFTNRADSLPDTANLPLWLERLLDNASVLVPIIILVILLLIAGLIVLNTFGRIGLARGAWLADQSSPGGGVFSTLDFSTLWQAGKRYFWRVLLLIVLLWALTLTLAFVILVPVIGLSVLTMGIGLICLLPLLCVLMIAFWALTVVADLAIIGIVNEDRPLTDAVRRAWEMFRARPADIVIMAVLLWIGSAVISFVVGLPMLLILAPLLAGLFSESQSLLQGGMTISVILGLLYLPVILLAQTVIQTFTGTTWTLVYRRISGWMQNVSRPTVIDVPNSLQ